MGPNFALVRGRLRVSLACACLVFGFTAFFSNPGHVQAFCRESTTSSPGGDCNVTADSVLLTWRRNCMTYQFDRNVFTRVPMGEAFVRNTFATSFQTWADVRCGTSGTPFLVSQAMAITSATDAEFLYDQPNESVVLVRTENEWMSLDDHDELALALTLIWHDKKSGEILDVDMELNGGAGTFTDCRAMRCNSKSIDLQNTVTHEAGHLLGLGHTDVRGATMQPSTTMSPEIEKRDLAPDDIAGYCSLDLPEGPCTMGQCSCPAPPIFSSTHRVRTCSCRTPGDAARGADGALWSAGIAASALASIWLRRRKRRS
jgi:hypothetical protein